MSKTVQRYTQTAILLHWITGLLLLAMFALGFWMHELPKEVKVASIDLFNWGLHTVNFAEPTSLRAFYFNLHKSIGVTLLALILARVLWRMTHTPPAFPDTLQKWEKRLAEGVHKLMYVLMVAMPVSGVVMATFSKYGIVWFGVPLIEGLDQPDLREWFKEVHEMVGITLLVLIVLHVAAAIKHRVVDRDEIMRRMFLH